MTSRDEEDPARRAYIDQLAARLLDEPLLVPPPVDVEWANFARKQRFIDQITAYADDTAGCDEELSYADVKAMATGDPKLLRAVANRAFVRDLLADKDPAFAALLAEAAHVCDTTMAAS